MIILVWTNLMQDRVPPEQLGRVGSIDNVSAILTMPLGMAVVGWALDGVDTYLVCVTAGCVTVATALLTLLHPKIREID